MARTLVVTLLLLGLLVGSGMAAAARPGRHLHQVSASATAISTGGASVNAESNAFSNNGAPTSSNVVATGTQPGTVDCSQTATNGQQLNKACQQNGGSSNNNNNGASASATASASASAGWYAAPRCKSAPSSYEVKRDTAGMPWGWDGFSCALRNDKDQPLL